MPAITGFIGLVYLELTQKQSERKYPIVYTFILVLGYSILTGHFLCPPKRISLSSKPDINRTYSKSPDKFRRRPATLPGQGEMHEGSELTSARRTSAG